MNEKIALRRKLALYVALLGLCVAIAAVAIFFLAAPLNWILLIAMVATGATPLIMVIRLSTQIGRMK